jgi:hypothetical protein
MAKNAVLHTTEEVQWVLEEWLDEWKVPVVVKKGAKVKEHEEVGTSHKSSISTSNTRKEVECTKSIVTSTTIKKPRKKEMVPRDSVLGTECTEEKNEENQDNGKDTQETKILVQINTPPKRM